MFSKLGALAILTLCFLVGQSTQEECVPQAVVNLRIGVSQLLSWSNTPDEPCHIDEYLVYIFHRDQPAEYAFSTTRHYVQLSFLEVCEEWVFVVVPVSGHTTGPQRRLVQNITLPPWTDLSVDYIHMHRNPDLEITYLDWGLTQQGLENCSLRYRVIVEELGIPVKENYYTTRNTLELYFLSSCTSYQFGVRTTNLAEPSLEGPLKTDTFLLPGRKQHPPVLIDHDSTPSTISLSFRLESEVRNPCEVDQIFIDGGSSFSHVIDINNEDRNPLNVTISSLLPGTVYDFDVYIHNSVGWSDATPLSIRTKDIDPALPYIVKRKT